jgi:hypothetical protein
MGEADGGLGSQAKASPRPLLQIPVCRVKVEPLGHLIHAFVRVGLEQKRFGQG